MFKVAFIDDGIRRDSLGYPKDKEHFKIRDGKIVKTPSEEEQLLFSHATVCFEIFCHYIHDRDYLLYDIEILGTGGYPAAMDSLECALEFCLEKEVRLINMSLGSTCFKELENDRVLSELYRRGVFMIAATNNKGLLTFPACSAYVIGVKRDYLEVLQKDEFCYGLDEIDHTNIISHCMFQEIIREKDYELRAANSFSAPYITAMIYNLLKDHYSREQVYEYLKSHSTEKRDWHKFVYRKKEYRNWKDEIDVPLIGILAEYPEDDHTLTDLLLGFRDQGFNAVGMACGRSYKKFSPYLYGYLDDGSEFLTWEEKLLCIFHATDADIMFVLYNESLPFYNQRKMDIVVNYINHRVNISDFVIKGEEDTLKVIGEIVTFFCPS